MELEQFRSEVNRKIIADIAVPENVQVICIPDHSPLLDEGMGLAGKFVIVFDPDTNAVVATGFAER